MEKSDERIRKIVGQVMVDKKEVSDLQSRQAILDLIGRDTPEGREAIKKISSFNPVLGIEAKLREERNTPLDAPLSADDSERILGELSEKLREKLVENKLGEIKSMSPDFFKDPRFRESVKEVFADPVDMAQLVRSAPRDMRVALKGLPGTVKGEKPS